VAEVKIHARQIIGALERASLRLAHVRNIPMREAEKEMEQRYLVAGIQFLRWADDNRKAIAAALAAEKEKTP
jgi:hypothetical protein